MEHIVRSTVTHHFDQHNIISDAKRGFQKRRSCESRFILTVDRNWQRRLTRQAKQTFLLDFPKAYDKILQQLHTLLKLDYYSIRRRTRNWIRDFLTNRTQRVVVEGEDRQQGK